VPKNGRRLERSELELRERLSRLEQAWLIACLVSRCGMRPASCSDEDPHYLIVEYDADDMNDTDLMDAFYLCGLHADPVPADVRPRAFPQ
jgi:hypothetical protein